MATTTYQDINEETLPDVDTVAYTVGPTIINSFIRYLIVSNPTTTPAQITINIVKLSDSVGTTNQYINAKTIPAGTSVVITELVGRNMTKGDLISAKASLASTLNFNMSVRELF